MDNEKLARVADMMNEFLRKENNALKRKNANLVIFKIRHDKLKDDISFLQGALRENEIENEFLRQELLTARTTIERLTYANRNMEQQLLAYDSDMTLYEFE